MQAGIWGLWVTKALFFPHHVVRVRFSWGTLVRKERSRECSLASWTFLSREKKENEHLFTWAVILEDCLYYKNYKKLVLSWLLATSLNQLNDKPTVEYKEATLSQQV